mmetsp:Transcript_4465/g.12148  ORF Transcript_4465/g.12148 Transcript_4465/m.12148 type:complete len:163 (-) Transcript_4465:779-1267(-)
MLCYNIYFYDRTGCIFYHEWLRPKPVKQGAGTLEDDQKQMFGLCWTLSNFCAALDPKGTDKPQLGAPRRIGQGCQFCSFTANNYKLHFLETPSGYKVVLNTSQDVGSLQETLTAVYDELLVARCIRSPLYKGPGQPIPNPDGFRGALSQLLRMRGVLPASQS